MKMRKSVIVLILILSILYPVFASGANEGKVASTSAGYSGTISIAAGSVEAQALKAVLKEYQKTNPKVALDIIITQNVTDFETMMTGWIASNSMPDMYTAQVGATQKGYASNGYLMPLTNIGIADRLVEGDRELITYNGDLYAFPMSTSISAIICNNEVLKKAGIELTEVNFPRKWSDFLAMLDKLVAGGVKYPVGLAGKDTSAVTAWTFQYIYQTIYGIDKNWYANVLRGKRAWNDELYLDMFQKYSEMLPYIAPNALGTDNNQMLKNFIIGESPIIFQTAMTVGNLRQIDPELDIMCIPSCFTDDPAAQTIITGFDSGFSITATTKQKELCIDFMKFLTSDVGSTIFANESGYLPTTKVNNAELDPAYKILMHVLQNGVLRTSPILSRQWIPGVKEIMKTGQQNWFAGQNAKTVADQIEAQHKRLMDANPDWVKNFLDNYQDI
jgi:ABC-type glycerol-3-phosphate transport system substrate-binding protein